MRDHTQAQPLQNPIFHIKPRRNLCRALWRFLSVPTGAHGSSRPRRVWAHAGGTGPRRGFPVGAVSLSASNFLFFHKFISLAPTAWSANANPDVAAHICAHLGLRYEPRGLRIIQLGAFNHLVWFVGGFFQPLPGSDRSKPDAEVEQGDAAWKTLCAALTLAACNLLRQSIDLSSSGWRHPGKISCQNTRQPAAACSCLPPWWPHRFPILPHGPSWMP